MNHEKKRVDRGRKSSKKRKRKGDMPDKEKIKLLMG